MDLLSGQKLLRCHSGQVVSAEDALKDKRIILFYFSASWCPPSRAFTPLLKEFYAELRHEEEEALEIIFVSGDDSPEEMANNVKEHHGDWLAVQHGAALGAELRQRFDVVGCPTLIVTDASKAASQRPKGGVISSAGRHDIIERGPKCFHAWLELIQ